MTILSLNQTSLRKVGYFKPMTRGRVLTIVGITILVLGIILAAFTGLSQTPLFQPIEGLTAEVAREMLESGDLLVPHFNYSIYADKPPLFYWVTVLGLKLFGNTEFGARFGLAMIGIAEIILVFLLGRLLYGSLAGLLGAVAFACSIGHIVFTRLMMVDVLFSTCVTASFLYFSLGYIKERHRLLWWTMAGVSIGMAVLTKSLIGLVFPVLTIGLFILLTRQWNLLKQRAMIGALIGFLAVVIPWHLYMILKVPGFAYHFFWNEQVLRFLDMREPKDYIGNPLPIFLLSALVWALPWSIYIPHIIWGFRHGKRNDSKIDLLGRYLPWLWMGSVIGFFSLTDARLFYYTIPALPAFVLLVGWFWSKVDSFDGKRFRYTLALVLTTVAIISAPSIVALPKLGGQMVPEEVQRNMLEPMLIVGICIAIGVVMAIITVLLRRYRTAFWLLSAFMLISCIPLPRLLIVFGDYVSLRNLLPSVERFISPNDVVVHRFVKDDQSEVVFYLKRKVRILKRPGEFHQPILGNSKGYYIEQSEFEKLWNSKTSVFLMVSHHVFVNLPPEDPPENATVLARHGEIYICCNPSAAERIHLQKASTNQKGHLR
jgi:4-amino-4-deoxy-L-arabinose transferase-like glycosyltransferase